MFAQGDLLLMVLYGIILVPLAEELKDADPTLLSPFYSYDTMFNGSTRKIVAQLSLLMDQCLDRGYFPEPSKPIFIVNNPEENGVARQEF